MIEKSAKLSPDRKYRYLLSRIWKPSKGIALFVCLNPSTADENIDDPTIRRCIRFAESWGYGGMKMVNLFALRSTDPKVLYSSIDPIGPENSEYIGIESEMASVTVAAWGVHGSILGRGEDVLNHVLDAPHYLALTKDGFPKHPLYLRKDLKPKPFNQPLVPTQKAGRHS
jgi:hypothetical protein